MVKYFYRPGQKPVDNENIEKFEYPQSGSVLPYVVGSIVVVAVLVFLYFYFKNKSKKKQNFGFRFY